VGIAVVRMDVVVRMDLAIASMSHTR
jgi:hypothetical protein